MKRFTRFFALLLVLLLTVCLFGACGKKDAESTDSTASVGLSTADVKFVDEDGESTYRIVRPEDNETVNASVSATVLQSIKKAYGVTPKNVSDDESGEGQREIIIGKCDRPEVDTALETLLSNGTGRNDEFIICTISDDIVILGATDAGTLKAVEYFNSNYVTGEVITGGINYLYSDPSKYDTLSLFGKDNLYGIKLVRPIYNVSYITQLEIDALDAAILEKTGYDLELVHDQTASTDKTYQLKENEPAEYEIIIGNCVRKGVTVYNDSQKADYEIRIEDKRIYLNGGSPYATAMAVTEFTKLIKNNSAITADMTVANGDYYSVIDGYDSASYYYPTWKDDFDGDEINYKLWDVRWDEVSSYPSAENAKTQYRGSSELKNNYVKDGKMYQCAIETSTAYYGGMFVTIGMMEYLYGHLELSTLHPKGLGFWTALWTQSSAEGNNEIPANERYYHIEVDVEECYGNGGDWAYGNTFAWPTALGRTVLGLPNEGGTVHVNNRVSSEDDRGFWMDFHTFGYEWLDNTHVRFTCDGYVYVDQELKDPAEQHAFLQPTFLRLSMACGAGSHGQPTTDPDEWQNTNKFIVDWVHIYQKAGQKVFRFENSKWKEYVR